MKVPGEIYNSPNGKFSSSGLSSVSLSPPGYVHYCLYLGWANIHCAIQIFICHTYTTIINKLTGLFTLWIDIKKCAHGWTRYKCSRCSGTICVVRASVSMRMWVGLPLLVDKEKSHNSCLFSDDQSLVAPSLQSTPLGVNIYVQWCGHVHKIVLLHVSSLRPNFLQLM